MKLPLSWWLIATATPFYVGAIQSPACFSLYRYCAKQEEIVYMFAHGLRANQEQGLKLFSSHYNKKWIIQQPFMLFDFPDAHWQMGGCRDEHVNLGQREDVARMKKAYEYVLKKMPDCEGVVLTGISRGAATSLNFMAIEQPERVKAIIVESPFDNLESVIKHLLKRYKIHWLPYALSMGMKIVDSKFEALKTDGLFPIDVIKQIPHNVPVLIVGVKSDDVVPIESTRRLYYALQSAGHKDTYLLELNTGQHGSIICGTSGAQYANCVHAFYKTYGLPHDEYYAECGMPTLACCQPACDLTNSA